ncbi:biopolymer transporter ExbD [Candidatus Dependentiae bacterium]|nr:biopolymer transporter ExbD [Candidatus Dependentiae bacterium]
MNSLRRRRKRSQGMPEVSLTPLIDTTLVLLVIFMVATPMMQNSLNVDLPQGQMNEGAPLSGDSLVVAVDAQSTIYLNNESMSLETLCHKLAQRIKESKENKVYVHCDKKVPSGMLVKIIDAMKYVAGVEHVVLPTEKP